MAVPPAGRMAAMRVEHGRTIRRRTGHRGDRSRKRRDDHVIVGVERIQQPSRRGTHRVGAHRHALAAVDEQREQRRLALRRHDVEHLRVRVLEDLEIRCGQALDEAPVFVNDCRFDQHAGDLRDVGQLERFENHGIAQRRAPTGRHFGTR